MPKTSTLKLFEASVKGDGAPWWTTQVGPNQVSTPSSLLKATRALHRLHRTLLTEPKRANQCRRPMRTADIVRLYRFTAFSSELLFIAGALVH
jgi:hypothetical protein